jgi:hypothetical protein
MDFQFSEGIRYRYIDAVFVENDSPLKLGQSHYGSMLFACRKFLLASSQKFVWKFGSVFVKYYCHPTKRIVEFYDLKKYVLNRD